MSAERTGTGGAAVICGTQEACMRAVGWKDGARWVVARWSSALWMAREWLRWLWQQMRVGIGSRHIVLPEWL